MWYSYEKLEIWRLGMDIAKETYRIMRSFPKDELWALTSQMRRAATSIPLNVAEGSSRRSRKDFALFLRRSLGSLLELLTAMEIAQEQRYATAKEYEPIRKLCEQEYFKIVAFEKKLLQ